MFVKYEKTFHVFPVTSKFNLDNTQLKRLFAGEVIVEEKMDGSNIGIIRHNKGFSLQKRNSLVGPSEHEQFSFFNNWAHQQKYEQIMSLPVGTLLYGELLYATHTIYYDKLPEYVLIFDAKQDGDWLDYDDRKHLCESHGFTMVPLVGRGNFSKNDVEGMVPEASAYGPIAEGIVIKRYAKHGYFRGKLVKPGFMKQIEESDNKWPTFNIPRNKLGTVEHGAQDKE